MALSPDRVLPLDESEAGRDLAPMKAEGEPGIEGYEDEGEPDEAIPAKLLRWSDPTKTLNIADELDEDELGRIAQICLQEYELDEESRIDWLTKAKKAMELAMQVVQAKTSPWPNASNVIYPLIAQAAIQFSARAYPAIIQGMDVVKGVVVGEDAGTPVIDPASGQPAIEPQSGQPMWREPPGAKRARADRIGEHMSWQLLEEQPEWEEDTDRLLLALPIVGCMFRKTFWDASLKRNATGVISPINLVIDYNARSVDTAPRLSEIIELYPYEIEEAKRAGLFLDIDFGTNTNNPQDLQAPHVFIEQHRRWDLDNDGYEEPYVITIHKDTAKIARIVARYDADGVMFRGPEQTVARIEPVQYYTKYDFIPNPDGGIYGWGFGQFLQPLNESINTAINQMFDAGTLQNTGGGFIGKGLSLRSGPLKFQVGEWKVVNSPGGNIKDAIVAFNHPGPSQALFGLLGTLITMAEKLASVNEVMSGQQSMANVPATTTLALIEQGLKVFTATYKRVHRALKRDFDKQYRLNRLYLEEQATYRRGETWRHVTRADYEAGAGVEPISDPTMTTDMQMLGRAQFLKEWTGDPFMNPVELRLRIFNAAKIEAPEDVIVTNPPPNPEMLAKADELMLQRIETQARAMKEMALAVKALADAEAAAATTEATQAQTRIAWMGAQLDALQRTIEAMGVDNGGPGEAGGAAGPGGQRRDAAGMGGMAGAPGQPSVPALSRGQATGSTSGSV